MKWRYLTKKEAGPLANPGYVNESGAKVFKSKVAKSWCANVPGYPLKTGFSTHELAQLHVEQQLGYSRAKNGE